MNADQFKLSEVVHTSYLHESARFQNHQKTPPRLGEKSRITLRIGFIHILLLLACLLQGCTLTLWKDAFTKEIKFYRVDGVAFIKSPNSDGSKYIIVSYAGGHDRGMLLVHRYAIQVVNGKIPQFFDYHGSKRTVKEIIADLPKEQLYGIQNYEFSEGERRLGESIDTNSSDAHPLKNFTRAKTWFENTPSSPEDIVISRKNYRLSESDITFFPYCWGSVVIPPKEYPSFRKDPADEPFDPRCKILMLPNKQTIHASEMSMRSVKAIFLTPLTLGGDVIFIPITAIGLIPPFSWLASI